MPIRAKLTLVFAVVMALLLATVGAILINRLRAELRATIDNGLRSRAEVIVSSGESQLPRRTSLIEGDESFAQILDANGEITLNSPGLTRKPLVAGNVAGSSGPRFFDEQVETTDEVIPARILAVPLQDGGTLLVGSSLEDATEAVRTLAGLLAIGGPIALGLAALLVWILTGAALRPVERLRQAAEALSISEVGRPLTVPDTKDEIARLGRSLNGLLARLAQALERERRFVDDASHELRTPVAILKAELELALSRSDSPEEMQAALRRALTDAEDLARLTEDLLVLARADQGRLPIRRNRVDLGELVEQVCAGFRARAESNGTPLEVRVDGRANLDPLRLRQVLNNLLDNALRHAEHGGTVSVASRSQDGALMIDVEDTGPGFPAEVLATPLEPFARPERDRARSSGAGLGLPIVRAIVEAHGGTVTLENPPTGGARVRLRFPH